MRNRSLTSAITIIASCIILLTPTVSWSQAFPPGTFYIDGLPFSCGPVVFVVTPNIPDVAIADGQGHIYLHPGIMGPMPTPLKLYIAAHECGHYKVGADESAADCWAIKAGRNQGWFPPQAFNSLIALLWNKPGDIMHPPGTNRLAIMMKCYSQYP